MRELIEFGHAAGVDDYTLTSPAGIIYRMSHMGRLAGQLYVSPDGS